MARSSDCAEVDHDGGPSLTELSAYVLEPLRPGGEFVLYRARRRGAAGAVLVLAPSRGQQALPDLRRLEHEYSLANDLDPAWAVRPLAIAQYEGRSVLVLENWPGKPLDS